VKANCGAFRDQLASGGHSVAQAPPGSNIHCSFPVRTAVTLNGFTLDHGQFFKDADANKRYAREDEISDELFSVETIQIRATKTRET